MKLIKKSRIMILCLVIGVLSALNLSAQSRDSSLINREDSPFQFFIEAETGVVKVLQHRFQSGDSGTNFNFVSQGGQEILFPIARVKAGAEIAGRHLFHALYQPLTLQTSVTFREDVTIDGTSFNSGTPMEIKYGFDFWRLTYGYDLAKADVVQVYLGLALQLRNASIVFQSVDGSLATTNQNLGPVPAVFAAFNYEFESGFELGFEATGLWASSSIINGADFEFEGSILDASLRASFPLNYGVKTFVNLRYLGGTAVGVSEYEDRFWTQATENYTSNILSTLSFTVGLSIR